MNVREKEGRRGQENEGVRERGREKSEENTEIKKGKNTGGKDAGDICNQTVLSMR